MIIQNIIAQELNIRTSQVEAVIKLIDQGNTIPFIARYRKEAHGSLNDEQLRNLDERLTYLRKLQEKKDQVLASIEEQGKLTPELKQKIEDALTMVEVDDLYRPYKPKRKTKASIARDKGLQPLADIIWNQTDTTSIFELAEAFLSDKEGFEVTTIEDAINGAKDILAEQISDNAEYREEIRRYVYREGLIQSEVKEDAVDEKKTYELYYEYTEPVNKIPGHRILAINRGENEKVLNVKIVSDETVVYQKLATYIIKGKTQYTEILQDVIEDSYKRLIYPSIEREIRAQLTENAEDGAIKVFGKNLSQLLMQPPITGHTVLGWDPAYRTGCKLAIVDSTGKVLNTTVIYPTPPQSKIEESKSTLKKLIKDYNITLISLGNGTASRESEQVICDLNKELDSPVPYVIVNESGASVYSASKIATQEFPNFDVGQRSATSMARRLQDPLSELVKMEPKAIGVGQYQHDMNQKKLEESLGNVVEDCVNKVGVDLNTASASLLSYVSGISKTLAENIVTYREQNGIYKNRKALQKVPKLGPKAFEQCAGFLRINNGTDSLDSTSVHPESYDAAKKLIKNLGFTEDDIKHGGIKNLSNKILDYRQLAQELGIGEETLKDIVSELEKPGRDPRDEMPKPILKSDVLTMEDLHPGMILKGTVRNVIDFGVFVDIGVHQDGLVHISQITNKFIKHPLEVLNVGDIVTVKVVSVDTTKKRISLTMKIDN